EWLRLFLLIHLKREIENYMYIYIKIYTSHELVNKYNCYFIQENCFIQLKPGYDASTTCQLSLFVNNFGDFCCKN
ncbi:Hypothetical predicted protein, partial [Paramuricea clavata]